MWGYLAFWQKLCSCNSGLKILVKLFKVVELHKKMIILLGVGFNAHVIITFNNDYLHAKLDRYSKYYVFASCKLFNEI